MTAAHRYTACAERYIVAQFERVGGVEWWLGGRLKNVDTLLSETCLPRECPGFVRALICTGWGFR